MSYLALPASLIPMSCVYSHYKYFYSLSAGIDFRRQILTSKVGPRTERVQGFLWLATLIVFCSDPGGKVCTSNDMSAN